MSELLLRLFISGRSLASLHAIDHLDRLCREGINGQPARLEVIDVRADRGQAEAHHVLVTPTLLFTPAGGEPRRVFGEFSDASRLLALLGLAPPP